MKTIIVKAVRRFMTLILATGPDSVEVGLQYYVNSEIFHKRWFCVGTAMVERTVLICNLT
jgi:hypothetical protein